MVLIVSSLLFGFILAAEIIGICRKSNTFEKDSSRERITHLLFPAAMLLLYLFRKITDRFGVWKFAESKRSSEGGRGKEQKVFLRKQENKDDTEKDNYPAGKKETGYYEKIYVGEDAGQIKKQCEAEVLSAMLGVLFAVSAVILLLHVSGYYEPEYQSSIKRPEQGTEEVKLTAVYGEECYDLNLKVDEVYPERQQMLKRLSETEEMLAVYMLGSNESLNSVTTDLNLRETYSDKSVTINWSSSDSELVRNDGTVKNEALLLEKEVELTAVLTCYEEVRTVNFTVTVKPVSKESAQKNLLVKNLEELLEETKKEEIVYLPETIEGQDLKFIKTKEDMSGKILLLGIVAALLILPLWYENKRNKLNDRRAELLYDYPEVLSKFAMLLESGLVIRAAFERIAEDYEKRRGVRNNSARKQGNQNTEENNRKNKREAKKRAAKNKAEKVKEAKDKAAKDKAVKRKSKELLVGTKGKRYVYEEMLRTYNEIKLGRAETEAYEAFGRRCGDIYYIRFSALLSQNVKKGSGNLIPQLHKEVSESLIERQQAIRKRGEETSMKLLLPMTGMFALVLAIILVPAFLSM